MTGLPATLEHVACHLPERVVTLEELVGPLGLSHSKERFFRQIQGLRELRQDPDISLFDLVLPAARQVLGEMTVPKSAIRYLVYAHATQTVALPGVEPAQVIRDELGLGDAVAFAVSQQNCASGMTALDIAAELLRLDGDPAARALVVTGEQAFSPDVQLVPDTAVMGEAAAACLVGIGGAGSPVHSYVTRTLGTYASGVRISKEKGAELGQVYPRVFAETMRRAVAEADLTLEDIDLLIPHNVNMMSWRQTIKALEFPRERTFLDNIPRYSHCFASDVFVNYVTLRDAGRLVDGHHYLMASVGVGTTFAAMVITHRAA